MGVVEHDRDVVPRAWGPRLGQRLEAARKRAGMNRAQLAARLAVTEESIRRWERGGARPSPESLVRLLAVLALDGAEFTTLGEHDAPAARATDDRPEIARRLREERSARGISQAEAGKQLGVAQATYAGWEIGRAVPDSRFLRAIADFLDLTVAATSQLVSVPVRVDVTHLSAFGRLLGQRREELQLTRDDLAERVGVMPRTVRAWELGEKTPRDHDLVGLADALDVAVDALAAALPRRDPALTPLGRLIRTQQRRLGLSREDLAGRAGLDVTTISRWVHGRHEPEPAKLEQLAGALEVDVDIVLDAAAAS
ncbi:MAG TPA: helix-turn-helix domain-containing protein [Acidimicrobiales bacterium]|nr:helix-turn-helix domain-containing protein [Acidimicrobiales bacterium]